jgi:hypothetical protein
MKRLVIQNPSDTSWKNNPNAVYVGRPSIWGNPYTIEQYGRKKCLKLYRKWLCKKLIENEKFLEPLRGKDLVCWCPLSKTCHADIIIEFIEHPILGSF